VPGTIRAPAAKRADDPPAASADHARRKLFLRAVVSAPLDMVRCEHNTVSATRDGDAARLLRNLWVLL
jgi:hypothetical protein